MSSGAADTPHDASPEKAIAAIRAFKGPLLLDLDETLYLRNSTEDFIDSARPGFAAAMLMQMLDWIKPWRWTGGSATRDVWRVRLVTLLLPWTNRRWRRRVPQLAQRFSNAPLVGAAREHVSAPIIVTMGFHSIVKPLIAALDLGELRIVAARSSGFQDRLRGKLALATEALGNDTVRLGLVITDSSDDLPLLDVCASPLRTRWPDARYRSALSGIYLPGRYISRIKHPGERYLVRGILQEDFAFWLLSSIGLAALPVLHSIGLLFLLLSFWTIYEGGYVDNDQIAARYESEPKLSSEFHREQVTSPRWEPWLWAVIAGSIAICLLRWPATPVPADFAKWLAVLLATHFWFRWYNRVDKQTRVWLYAGLQFSRGLAFAVLVPVALVGTLALAAHVLARWLSYYVYRLGGKRWPTTLLLLTRLLFFVVIVAVMALTQGVAALTNWTCAALLGWNLFRARDELRAVFANASRLDRAEHPPG